MQNRIDAVLSATDRDKILDSISQIRALLPFLINLTPEERRELPRMGDKSRAFVLASLNLAEEDDSFLPRSFDKAEMRRDEDLFVSLTVIYTALAILFEKLQDTMLLTGSDLYVAALEIYDAAKRKGGSDSGGLDQLLDALGQRFARRRTKKTEEPPQS